MCIENTNELDQTIKVAFDVQDTMKGIEGHMKEEEDRENDKDHEKDLKELDGSF